MDTTAKSLRFVWWNVQDFAHYEPGRPAESRWPTSLKAYEEKCRRIDRVLQRMAAEEPPRLLAFAEITERAAQGLRDRVFPGYSIHKLPALYSRLGFHVAVLYDPTAGFQGEDLITVSNVPDSTRPMALLDHCSPGHRIRFVACHWTARFGSASERSRTLSAQELSGAIYGFLHPDSPDGDVRHVVILGDLNDEPYDSMLAEWLFAFRDRAASRRHEHYTDQAVGRVRLYNCAWRLLGEHSPHQRGPIQREMAGSYYWRDQKTWHTFDQVIVSGTLLNDAPPFLDEANLRFASGADVIPDEFLGGDGLPHKFAWNNGKPVGLSDHLPICGRIVLE